MEKTKEILITNDDSVNSKGVIFLANMMKAYGNVTVVAPAEVQSGKSAALSLAVPMYLKQIHIEDNLRIYSFGGTPVDCVKLAMNVFFKDKTPDLLISGINHGSNASVASLYSGTLGACIEGTIYDIPSVGFSICTHDDNPDFSVVEKYGSIILDKYFTAPPSEGIYLNVNFPNLPPDEVKGIRFARRGYGRWIKEYEKMKDSKNEEYYFMTGSFENLEKEDSMGDHILNSAGYVTVVPHKIDTTDYAEIDKLSAKWKIR